MSPSYISEGVLVYVFGCYQVSLSVRVCSCYETVSLDIVITARKSN